MIPVEKAVPPGRLLRWSEAFGMASLGLFCTSIALSTAGMYLGLVGMLLALAPAAREFWTWTRRQPAFWPAIGLTAWILVCATVPPPIEVPAATVADATRDLLRLAGIPALIVGWWLSRLHARAELLFAGAALGLIAAVLLHFDWAEPARYLEGFRPSFGLGGKNAPSVFGGILIIGCLTVGRALPAKSSKKDARVPWHAIVWGVLIAAGVFLLVVGQSRSVWLAAIAVLGTGVALVLRRSGLGGMVAAIRAQPLTVFAVVGIVISVCSLWAPVIAERAVQEAGNWAAVLTLDFDGLTSASIGYRIAMWRIALEQIAHHPITGTGPGAAAALTAAADSSVLGGRTFPHFHNAYLEIGVSLGLPGLALSLALLVALALPALHALQGRCWFERAFGQFTVLAGVLILVLSLFQIRFDDPAGMALYLFVCSCAVACSDRNPPPATDSPSARCDREQRHASARTDPQRVPTPFNSVAAGKPA